MVMERISAFVDGEAGPAETRHAVLHLKQDAECYATWSTFHLIGDTMRGEAVLHDGFMARFRERIAQEPTQLAPRLAWRRPVTRYALSAAASLCAIAVVLALVFTDNPLRPQAQLAAAPNIVAPAPARGGAHPRPTALANQGKMNEYLMAHQEFSPSTALQGVAPYVRTVSESHEGSER
jgi:sigma-E factor negative regulatory protein RseA